MAIVVAAATVLGLVALRAFSTNSYTREILAAAAVTLLAGEVAQAPLILSRGGSQDLIAQAGLMSTVMHLLLCLTCSVTLALVGVGARQPLLLSMVPFYWISLGVLVITIIQTMQVAQAARD